MLHHELIGEGPRTTLLLHGLLGSGRNLRGLARRWAERDQQRTFVLPDLTGHGRSPPLPAGATLATVAGDVFELASHVSRRTLPSTPAAAEQSSQGIEVVGHSLGGRVALSMTRLDRGTNALADVVLLDVAPGPVQPHRDIDAILAALLAAPAQANSRQEMRQIIASRGLERSLVEWLLMNLVLDGGIYRWGIDRFALAAFRTVSDAENLWDAVERPGSPVHLCVRGGRSSFVSAPDVERLMRAGCGVETLRGAGHFVHIDASDALLDILERHRPAAASKTEP